MTVQSEKINHGSTLFVDYDSAVSSSPSNSGQAVSGDGKIDDQIVALSKGAGATVAMDEVDRILDSQEGKIMRQRDEKLCQHAAHSKCVHCFPIDPFDEEFLMKKEIKHMSFHAYIKKLTTHHGRSSNMYPLTNISLKLKPGCRRHEPWPRGICSNCQPGSLTLMRQIYRHVDNISFENQYLVNRFLDFWRRSGHQRVGFLIGRYEVHPDVPLGIRAVVSAIYEPPQNCSPNFIELLDDPKVN